MRCALVLAVLAASLAGTARAGEAPTPVDPGAVDPGARLPEGSAAAEHWDLVASFDSGERLVVRFLITNEGPGEHTAAAFGHLLRPGMDPVEFHNGRRAGRWQLSDDRRRIHIGSSLLDLGDDARHFEVDKDKRRIWIQLDFPADGTARAATAPGGYGIELLNLATPASGRFRLGDMPTPQPLRGRVVLTHTHFARPERELLARRIDVATFAAQAPLYLCDLLAPDGGSWRWLVVGGRSPVSRQGPPDLSLALQGDGGGRYPVPSGIDLRGEGLEGHVSLGGKLLEADPLAALPTLLRMVYSFGPRPRHLWLRAGADVALKSPVRAAVLHSTGEGIASLSFPDALPQSER